MMHQQSEPLSSFAEVDCTGESVTDSGRARSSCTREACSTLPVRALKGAHSARNVCEEQLQAPPCKPASSQTFERVVDRTDECIRLEATKMQIKHSSLVNTATEVVFRSDFMTYCDTRVAMLVVYAATFAGAIILLVQFINIMTKDASTNRYRHSAVYVWNVAGGGTCLTLNTGIFIVHLYRVLQANRQHKIWKSDRKRLAILFLAEAGVQWVNLVLYVAANGCLLIDRCLFFSPILTSWFGWVRWTCWNTNMPCLKHH